MATVSLWAGLRFTMATLRWAEPIPMATAPLWAGLRVTMTTQGGGAKPYWQQYLYGRG